MYYNSQYYQPAFLNLKILKTLRWEDYSKKLYTKFLHVK